MIRRVRRTSLLVAFCLLTSVATAYAECAWVLWTKAETAAGPGSTDWGIVHATPSRADCIVALERTARGLKDVVIVGDIRAGSFMAAEKALATATSGNASPTPGGPTWVEGEVSSNRSPRVAVRGRRRPGGPDQCSG